MSSRSVALCTQPHHKLHIVLTNASQFTGYRWRKPDSERENPPFPSVINPHLVRMRWICKVKAAKCDLSERQILYLILEEVVLSLVEDVYHP
jgi:hypothetical protein